MEHRDQPVETIQSCVNDIGKWMTANKLKLNKDKTGLIVISSEHLPRPQLDTLTFGSESVFSTNDARNVGVTMDDKINFEKQMASICKSSFYHIRNIARIRGFLSVESTRPLSIHLLHAGWITATRFSMACRRIRLKSFNLSRTVLLV